MQDVPKVAAVCVNWNGGDSLKDTLESIIASDYTGITVLVVDNASTDGSLENLPPGTRVLRLSQNYGYGEALNRGIEYLEREEADSVPVYYLFMNNDLTLDPETVSGLVAEAEKNGPGIYGPSVVCRDNPGQLEAAWGRITWSHVLTRLSGKGASASLSRWNRQAKDVILLGSVMLVHRGVLDSGLRFDPHYFMYHEEVDFIYAAAGLGFSAWYCPGIRAVHSVGLGTRREPLKKVYWTRRNSIYFLRKHRAGAGKWLKCLGTMLGGFVYAFLTCRLGRARAIASGAADGLRGFSENPGRGKN